jgi:hypothetical protein
MTKKIVHPKLRGKVIREVSTWIDQETREIVIEIVVKGKEDDCWAFTAGSEVTGKSVYLAGDNLKRSNEKTYKF